MRVLVIIIVVFGVFTSNTTFSQKKNRISIQTGLFHEYFDGTPLFNLNYHKDYPFFQNRFFISYGTEYSRFLNKKSSLSFSFHYLRAGWYDYIFSQYLVNKVVARTYFTFNLSYDRRVSLSKHLQFLYGGGLTYRHGYELVIVAYYIIPTLKESHATGRGLDDVGLNAQIGLEYTPIKWLTIYTKFNLLGLIYLNDKKDIKELRQVYHYKSYPSRFDLSWQFGVGFNFGK